ncbi:MAG: hypothetical protein Ct9H300mP5_5320 [Candidatus Pelagibacterales bacterium]|nr:MAG: hypothetical protein Ct9H300mP5_5320 [Pelagibacterales bacterium]
MVKSKTINLKEKTFVVYTDGVTGKGFLKKRTRTWAEGVQKIVTKARNITPKKVVDPLQTNLIGERKVKRRYNLFSARP